MSHQVIEVIVMPNGQTKIQTQGFVGSSCKQASLFLETALGISSAEQLTSEFYQTENCSQSLRQGG